MQRPRTLRTALALAAASALVLLPATPAAASTEVVVNGTFANGTAGWWNSANTAVSVDTGRLKAVVTGGTANPWDAQVGQSSVPLQSGVAYVLSFDASASAAVTARTVVQLGASPYTGTLNQAIALTTTAKHFSFAFTSTLTTTAGQVLFQLGGGSGYTFYVDNVSLLAGPNPIGLTSGFYVDPNSNPATWVAANPADSRAATIQAGIASKPMARWFGNWSGDITTAVAGFVGAADTADKLPILVAYNIPGRDACGGQSGGGAGSVAAYKTWIAAFANAIGNRPAIVVLEPDALGDFSCMDTAAIAARNDMLVYATQQFRDHATNTWAYLDGGNAGWVAADTMAQRLYAAGVGNVRGFSLNVSNYYTTAETTTYGNSVNSSLQTRYAYTKPYVIDTSRNGNGGNGQWCNPAGRKLGAVSQVGGGAELLLWVKVPGDSDGQCGIAPTVPAGTFSADLAVHLITGV
ncbi:glycoside hydrolase family 6 protein [Hamadaea tsunoensis]|uniref:glycoside hydrolase family 6 protein n=1 Tax=Hamadaea tsunoensis TaxID=53368 RepID=UPI0003F505A2|nr:glycoside hydrolase family 6 protein [Hamadaea tsunoensis]